MAASEGMTTSLGCEGWEAAHPILLPSFSRHLLPRSPQPMERMN
jgi:hypothetical protein